MMTLDQLVGRLMDLETKFYELQDRYQTLINDYEQLKEKYEAKRSGYWISLSTKEREEIHEQWVYNDSLHDEQDVINVVEKLLKEKNEDSLRHRNDKGLRYDPFTCNQKY